MLGNHRNLGACCGMMQCCGSLGNWLSAGVRTGVLCILSGCSTLELCPQPLAMLFSLLSFSLLRQSPTVHLWLVYRKLLRAQCFLSGCFILTAIEEGGSLSLDSGPRRAL